MKLSFYTFEKRSAFVFAGIIFLTVLFPMHLTFAQTEVAGDVFGVWNVEGSPYIAIEAITVPAGEQLTIEPGVEVRFEEHFPLVVNGLLRAVGTEEDSIWFITNRWREDIRWGGIQFLEADDGCEIAFSHISTAGWVGAPQTVRGILINRCSAIIRNSLITNCTANGGIWVWFAPEAIIENNTIEDIDGGAIWCSGEGITRITGNLIHENAGYGIDAYSKCTVLVRNNQILDNTGTGLILRNTSSIAENNLISRNARAGINSSAARAVIKGNVISDNASPDNGAGIAVSGNAIICGNLILNNASTRHGGGVSLGGDGQVHLYNNVIFGNQAEDSPGGVFVGSECQNSIQNCIIWSNQGNEINTDHANIGFSNVQQGIDEEGMLQEDPGFVDPENGDFRLAENSPCIDAGNEFQMYTDADGSRNDMGAYGGNDLLFGFTDVIEFPEIGIYCHSKSNFVLCNLYEDEVTLSRINLTDRENFSVEGETPLDLPPDQWIDFPVIFNPREAGEYEEFFSLIFEDFELFNRALFTLTGTALDGVSGNVHGVWTQEMSPINVIGNAVVPIFDTLRIEPGVVVTFDPEARLSTHHAYGALYAIGTLEDSIFFTSSQEEPQPGDWSRLHMRGELAYCVIEYGERGVWLNDGWINFSTIRNIVGTGASVNGTWQNLGPSTMSNSMIENCGLGVTLYPSSILIHSTIINCRDAIYPLDGGYAYYNLFAFNEEVNIAHSYWFGFDEMFEFFAHLTCEGNIFFQNESVSTFRRPHPAFSYNCVFESPIEGGPVLGELDHENLNGTDCDDNFNITVDPQFINPDEFDFRLIENSPCIDAGNPDWERDADGSWADIAPFAFFHDDGDPTVFTEPEFIETEGDEERAVNLTNIGDGRLYWRIDSGVDWVSCDPYCGILEENRDADIFVIIDNPDFEPGIYETDLIIDSNDPENHLFAIPITMRIGGENIRALEVLLAEGWNLISINVDPLNCYVEGEERGPDINRMFEPIVDNLIMVKDEQGRFYAPEFEFNNIPFWNLTEGYLVKTSRNIEITWSGEIIPAETDVPLSEGWNFAAYFPTFELDASTPDFYVLSPVIDNVIIAKDGDGRFLSPEFGFSNMLPWRASEGYQIRVDADVVLNYPENREEVALSAVRRPRLTDEQRRIRQARTPDDTRVLADAPVCQIGHWAATAPTSQNMSILITGLTVEQASLSVCGSQIAAFSPEGLLVGSGFVGKDGKCGIAVWGDDKTTEEVDGLRAGEAFELNYWNSNNNTEIRLKPAEIICGNSLDFRVDEFVILSVNADNLIPETLVLSPNFPNPFNSITKISFGLPETTVLSLQVFDISGRVVCTLATGEYKSGYHNIVWDAESFASGVYFINLQTEQEKNAIKVVLVR